MRHRPPSDVRRGLIASTWEGAFAQAFILWTGGVFLVDFGRRLGADEGMLGVLASLPFLAQAVQLLTAGLYERAGAARAAITRRTLLAARLLWVVPAGLALWGPRDEGALTLYLTVVFVSALLSTTGAHGWTSWMADLVPRRVRGRYFGFRSAVATTVAIAAGVGGGWLLDVLEARRGGLGFATVLVLAALAGLAVSIRELLRAPRDRGLLASVASLAGALLPFVDALRAVMLRGNGLEVVWPNLLALFAFFLFMLLVATKRFQRRLA